MKLKNFIFVGVFLAGLFSGTSAVLATENGTECDAVAIENVLEQARGIAASAAFLQELKPEIDDTKKSLRNWWRSRIENRRRILGGRRKLLLKGKRNTKPLLTATGGETVGLIQKMTDCTAEAETAFKIPFRFILQALDTIPLARERDGNG